MCTDYTNRTMPIRNCYRYVRTLKSSSSVVDIYNYVCVANMYVLLSGLNSRSVKKFILIYIFLSR